ncbi:hypothetical protein B0H14DRAFT_2627257 [Mycena olivaceomarginata]|nr:hypothetical protein B0H14DRAFT_2627257 [Mycena olivaceomarginata]
MKRIGSSQLPKTSAKISRFATNIPSAKVTFYTVANIGTGATVKSQQRWGLPQAPILLTPVCDEPNEPTEPNLPFSDATEEAPGAIPAYETTPACNEKGDAAKAEEIRQTIAHMKELKDEEPVFLRILMSLHYSSQLNAPCSCGQRKQTVACQDCLQAELLCRQCWVKKHQTMPTHWALVWNEEDRFFEKHDFSLVLKNGTVRLGHYGEGCPNTELGCSFTLVEWNRIHATTIAFSAGGGYIPREHQGPSDWCLADPNFANRVPDIYKNFLAITRFYENIQIIIESGEGHGLDIPLAGKVGRPYPNRPKGFLGLVCAACPEPGTFNQPVPEPRRDKHDNRSDTALTDGNMYFAKQAEFKLFLKTYVIPEEDKEVPCKAHIGSIRHQGSPKYGNTAVSGVVGCACDHAILGSFIDMVKGEAQVLTKLSVWEHLRHKNTPLLSAESQVPMVQSYDSYCLFVVNQTRRGVDLFPEETWFHDVLKRMKGQIPADHIRGHGIDCQALWLTIYFACRAHFHGETAEVIWAFLNGLGSSTRQMTGGSRHDIINFVMHAWNLIKYLRHAELLAAERLDALQLFELHMAVVEELSRQHATEVVGSPAASISTSPRKNLALTAESTLAAMITVEQEKLKRDGQHEAGTSVVQWIHDGMAIERQQALAIVLLWSHRDHLLQETWDSITRLRDSLEGLLMSKQISPAENTAEFDPLALNHYKNCLEGIKDYKWVSFDFMIIFPKVSGIQMDKLMFHMQTQPLFHVN